jgi:hypothetical protein
MIEANAEQLDKVLSSLVVEKELLDKMDTALADLKAKISMYEAAHGKMPAVSIKMPIMEDPPIEKEEEEEIQVDVDHLVEHVTVINPVSLVDDIILVDVYGDSANISMVATLIARVTELSSRYRSLIHNYEQSERDKADMDNELRDAYDEITSLRINVSNLEYELDAARYAPEVHYTVNTGGT